MLEYHVTRLSRAGLAVYVATTTNASDDPVVELAEHLGCAVFRGSEDDVLSRYAGCVRQYGLDTVVRTTSDCPLIDGRLVARGVAEFEAAGDPWLYLSNGLRRTYPRGFDFEVFSATALIDADSHATTPTQREHVTPYLYQGNGRVHLREFTRSADASHYRVTLDTPDDFRLLKTLIEDHRAADLDAEGIITVLETYPGLADLNAHIEQKKLGQ
jgi:spore coat polysaccharide biosynthesis protein SpsF